MFGRLFRAYVAGPEHPTKYRFVRWLGRNILPPRGVLATVHPDARLFLNPVDWVDYLLLRDGSYEPLTLDFLQANLRPGDQAIFAGVNNGLHAIVAARAVAPAGRVLAVDPQPSALLRTRANAAVNDLPPGVLIPVAAALGAAPALQHMSWPPPDSAGNASFFRPGEGFIAPIFDLAHLATNLGIDHPRLLLLDIQGYEPHALAGLGPLRPEIAVIEDDPTAIAAAGFTRAGLFELLFAMGYRLHDLYGRPVDANSPPLTERNLCCTLPGVEVRWAEPPASRNR